MTSPLGIRSRRGFQELPASPVVTPPSGFDPASLPLVGWWRASYAGSPWAAVPSAGTSLATGDLTEGALPPLVGPALNGLTTAEFVGASNLRLATAGTVTSIFPTANYHLTALFYAYTAGAPSPGSAYNEEAILAHDVNGYLQLSWSTRGVTFYFYDPGIGSAGVETTVACGTLGWHLVHAWFDGTNAYIQLDSGAVSAPVGIVLGPQPALENLVVGRSYNGVNFFDGQVAEILMADTDLGSTARGNIKSYVNARYSLAL